jgi:hypothetical protein
VTAVLNDTLPFCWHSFDVQAQLPPGWRDDIMRLVEEHAVALRMTPTSVTSREASTDLDLTVHVVDGVTIATQLPWLEAWYRGRFARLAQTLTGESVTPASDVRYGLIINVVRGAGTGYECHVDSNPMQGVFYVTDHPVGAGGELVVSNRGDVRGRREVDADAAHIPAVAGHVVFFDARSHSHYVAPLKSDGGVRIAVAMTYYTASHTEESRPADLDEHLFGGQPAPTGAA